MRQVWPGIGAALGLILLGGVGFVAAPQHLTFDAPFPPVFASTDSAVIERGHYLVRTLAPCASCHGDPSRRADYFTGAETPLIGGFVFDIPPGQFFTRDLRPDPETGSGRVSDGAIARALRYGVGYDGRALLPFMEMQGLADDDLVSIAT